MRKLWAFLLCGMMTACRPEVTLHGRTFVLMGVDSEITLSFDAHDKKYTGQAVNRFFGTYREAKQAISFGAPASTMYRGAEEDMIAEEEFLEKLSYVRTYVLDSDKLVLILENGERLVLTERKSRAEF